MIFRIMLIDISNLKHFGFNILKPLGGISAYRTALWGICFYWDCFGEQKLSIGCQGHEIMDWACFSDDQIDKMDRYAVEYWTANKETILTLALDQWDRELEQCV